jgi:hypothetical protein
MSKRGKVLRDTSVGAGLLVVEGQQYPFRLEGTWKSEVPPAAGMTVDVDFDVAGQVSSARVVTDSQLAKEQAQAALEVAKGKGAEVLSGAVARFGAPNLVAVGILIVGWFFLSAVSIQTPVGAAHYTFWQLLGFLNARNAFEVMMQAGGGGSSTGIYGFLAIICIAGPFVHYFWKDKRAVLCGLLPLVFMLIVGLMAHSSYSSALSAGTGGDPNNPLMQQMQDEIAKAISVGSGVYLSALAAIYFAGISTRKFLNANASGGPSPA